MSGTTIATRGADDELLPWHDPEFCHAPWPWYDRMLREKPVAVMSDGLVVVSKYADVMAHLKDRSLVAVPLEGMGDSPWAANLNSVLLTEGERHTRIRRAFGSWFTPKMCAQWGQVAAQSASDALDAMGPDGIIEGHRALGVQPAQDAMAHVLGISREDGFPYIHATNLTMETMFGTDPEDVRRANEAFGYMMFQADTLIAAKRAQRGDGMLLDKLIQSVEDGDLTERELKESVQILWGSAAHNPGMAMAGALADLAANPWVFTDYKTKPDRRDDIVSELIRRALPEVAVDRFATEPLTIRGVDVAVGTAVRFMLGAALRDPDVFPDPDVFDYDRPPSASAALAFGLGTHHCAGQALARAEMRAVLDVLADRYDHIEVVGEPVWLFTPRHRNCEGLVVRLG
jgi:cytochrome P450